MQIKCLKKSLEWKHHMKGLGEFTYFHGIEMIQTIKNLSYTTTVHLKMLRKYMVLH